MKITGVVVMVCALALAGVAWLPAQGAAASSTPTPVQVTFSASGTATVDQHYSSNGGYCATHDVITLTWVATWNAQIDNGLLEMPTASNAGTLAAVGPGTMALTESGICTLSPGGGSCSATLSPGTGYPSLALSGVSAVHMQAQSLPSTMAFSGCGGFAQTPFAGSDLSVLEASLPGSTTGVTDIPAGAFSNQKDTYTAAVSSGQAPDQIASSCLGVGRHGSGNDSCAASMNWTGTIQIKPEGCGGPKVKTVVSKDLSTGVSRTLSQSEWNGVGITSNEIQPGETIGSSANEQLTIVFDDESPGMFGSMWVVGPQQTIHVPVDCQDQMQTSRHYSIVVYSTDPLNPGRAPHSSYFFFEPDTYSNTGAWTVVDAEGHVAYPCNCSRGAADLSGRAAAAAARTPIAFTVSLISSTHTQVHVIEGQVRAAYQNHTLGTVTAGRTADLIGGHLSILTTWPHAPLSLVPASQRPPTLSRVSTAPLRGRHLTLHLHLDAPAQITLTIVQGRTRVISKTVRARRGTNAIVLTRTRWPHGRCQLTLIADRGGRVGVQTLTFRL